MKTAPAVAIVINSPGGSAVQSHLIYKRIRALAEEKHKRVIVAVEDVAASGGYIIALAGDEIIVDRSSIVGSIGVISAASAFRGSSTGSASSGASTRPGGARQCSIPSSRRRTTTSPA